MKYTFYIDYFSADDNRYIDRELKAGVPVMVLSKTDLTTGSEKFYISTIHAENGFPGNIDSSYMCFHGWRGTCNNIYTEAHGVYTIKSVEYIDNPKSAESYTKVVLNRTDTKKGQD